MLPLTHASGLHATGWRLTSATWARRVGFAASNVPPASLRSADTSGVCFTLSQMLASLTGGRFHAFLRPRTLAKRSPAQAQGEKTRKEDE